jgi:anti-anti-sigma factor
METHRYPGYILWRLTGELDAFAAGLIRHAGASLCMRSRLLIDVSTVSFIDHAGLTALVGAVRRVRDLCGSMAVICTRSRLMAALDMAGLRDIVLVTDNLDEAKAAITACEQPLVDQRPEPGSHHYQALNRSP